MKITVFTLLVGLVFSAEQWFDELEFEKCELELTNGKVGGKVVQIDDQNIEIYRGLPWFLMIKNIIQF